MCMGFSIGCLRKEIFDYLVSEVFYACVALKYDLVGKRFGRLLVVEHVGCGKFLCQCDCGNRVTNVLGSDLRLKRKSCGCIRKEIVASMKGMYNSSVYKSWAHAKARTTLKTHKNWDLYGGRGIVMCDRWINSFPNFYEDMGDKPSPKHSLDRIDTNGPYSPENCRWATVHQQTRNKRNNVWITIDGETKIMEDWAMHFGIHAETFRQRIANQDHPSSWVVSRQIKKRE